MSSGEIEQAVRRSHCSHKQRDEPHHQCIGECKITRDGVELSCKACGKGDELITPADTLPETKLVRGVLDALGISYDVLTPEVKARAAKFTREWMGTRRWG